MTREPLDTPVILRAWVPESTRRRANMRAVQLGLNLGNYLASLVEDDAGHLPLENDENGNAA